MDYEKSFIRFGKVSVISYYLWTAIDTYKNAIDGIDYLTRAKLFVLVVYTHIHSLIRIIFGKIVSFLIGCDVFIDDENDYFNECGMCIEFFLCQGNFLFNVIIPFDTLIFSIQCLNSVQSYIDTFAVKIVLPSIGTHFRVNSFILMFIMIHFAVFCFFFKSYSTKKDFFYCLILKYLLQIIIKSFVVLTCHFLFIFDRKNFGSSIRTEKLICFANHIGNIINAIASLTMVVHCIRSEITAYWGTLVYSVYNVYQMHMDLIHFLTLSSTIKKKLPDATDKEIGRDDVCIVCREQMTVGNAKILPCGHCCHTVCLERWANKTPSCPLCKRDLRNIGEEKANKKRKNDNYQNLPEADVVRG